MNWKRATLAAAVAAFALAPLGKARAADPSGMWLTEEGDAKIKVAPCGSAICGTIAWLKQPNDASGKPKVDRNNADASKQGRPVIGVPVVLSMKPEGADKWSGQLYNAEDGKTYSGSLTLANANTMKVQGCVMVICKTKTWTRSN